jgi:hypothetical protein
MLNTLSEKVDPKHSAPILVDVQNDFCADGGAMHREGRDLTLVKRMIPRLERLLEASRTAKVPCIWIRCAYNTGPNHYLSEVWLEQAKRRRNGAYVSYPVCEPGEWNGDFFQVKPLPSEVIVTKHRYGAFEGTDLDLVLRSRGIRTVRGGTHAGRLSFAWPKRFAAESARRRPTHVGGRAAHGFDDVLVTRAAAEIGRQNLENLLVRQVGIGLQRVDRQHQEARRTKAALKRVMSDECVLQRMQLVTVRKAFDRPDAFTLRLHREHQAGPYRVIVEDHRACATNAVLATDMRPGQPAFVANDVDQCLSRLDSDRVVMSVDMKLDFDLLSHRP